MVDVVLSHCEADDVEESKLANVWQSMISNALRKERAPICIPTQKPQALHWETLGRCITRAIDCELGLAPPYHDGCLRWTL